MANVYQDGEVVQEPGGGVCQVSSTIFSALLYTDLEVVQRQNHSMIVNYVPRGMDATVYWDQPDFRFKNNHAYPIKLSLSFEKQRDHSTDHRHQGERSHRRLPGRADR